MIFFCTLTLYDLKTGTEEKQEQKNQKEDDTQAESRNINSEYKITDNTKRKKIKV